MKNPIGARLISKEPGLNSRDGKEQNVFTVSIIDTGIGIGADDIPYIFNRFKKFRQSMQQDSFGLGLPIVKSIATFHRIKIEVDSVKDLGSNFRLVFPADIIGYVS